MAYSKSSQESIRRLNRSKKPNGYIYIIQQKKDAGVYKIGVSANPKRRLKDIDSHNPYGVRLIFLKPFKNVYNMEECIHDSFSQNLMRKEWFKICKDDMKLLMEDLAKLSDEGVYLIRRNSEITANA